MKIKYEPEIRIQRQYNGKLTILEGSELEKYLDAFWKYMKSKKAPKDFTDRVLVSVFKAHLKVNGYPLSIEELEDLSTADARKIDLFFRGMRKVIKDTIERIEAKSAS